jgi:hypothetical protein
VFSPVDGCTFWLPPTSLGWRRPGLGDQQCVSLAASP